MFSGDLELNPVDFLTVGTVGPRGNRTFHLQGRKGRRMVTLTIEKMQADALAEAINDLLDELDERHPPESGKTAIHLSDWQMELRDPVDPMFRVAQIGLGYEIDSDMVVLVTQELITAEEMDIDPVEPRTVRFWGTRSQMRALALHAAQVVARGRPDPKQNGRIHYYWT